MYCEIYNGHPAFRIGNVSSIVQELTKAFPIAYINLSVAFVTEKVICDLHQRFLSNPEPTDVITFPADAHDTERTGEICISVDEALKYVGVYPLEEELTLYLVHGWLHLVGYNDLEEEEVRRMRKMEKKVLDFLKTQPTSRLSVREIRKKR